MGAVMFEKLFIQNFQTHEKLRIDFDPAITSIVGPSDAGKSAIIRALRWVCINQPNGDAFIRHGTKGATVRLVVDGRSVTRRRAAGGRANEYKLDDQEFTAFGIGGVPEPIEGLLNLGPVSWQGQHDPAFWLSATPGEVSRQLNAIVNLGIIDDTLTGVGRAVTRARSRLEVAEENLTKAKAEHDNLAWVPVFAADLDVVNTTEADFNKKAARAATCGTLLQTVVKYQSVAENAADAATRGRVLTETGEKALITQKRAEMLRNLINTTMQYETAAAMVVPGTDDIETAFTCYKETANRGKALRNLIDNIYRKGDELCRLKEELKIAKAAVPEQCPTCGRSL